MSDDAHPLTDHLRKAFDQYDRLAGLIRTAHRAAVPAVLPDLPPLRFGVAHRARAAVFDAWRAGDGVTAILANAAGHGGTAELLALFVKQAVAAEELRSAGELPPGEMLARVNRLLLDLELQDPPFVSMAFVRIDGGGRVVFARAAVPGLVHIPRAGTVEEWPTPGPLLGVFEASFPTAEGRLNAGDKLLLTTGGESLLVMAERHHMLSAAMLADAVAPADSTALVVEFHA
jgi:hypothetical protein